MFFDGIIGELNPGLPEEEWRIVATFIMGSLEGVAVFAGYERPWRSAMPAIETIAYECFVKELEPGEIREKQTSIG